MPFSFHTHSGQFCKHARGTLEEIVQKAIAIGYTHVGLSEHMPRQETSDLYPEEEDLHMTPADLYQQFKEFVSEAKRLKEAYRRHIHVLVGMETEYIRQSCIDEIVRLREEHCLDYVVGSVHHVQGMAFDFDEEWFARCHAHFGSMQAMCSAYYSDQFELLSRTHPDVVGHFDRIQLFRSDYKPDKLVWEAMQKNIKYCIDYGALFEVNSAYMATSGEGQPSPNTAVLKFIVSSGGKLTLSDDCHAPEAVAINYESVHDIINDHSLDGHIYYLEIDNTTKLLTQKPVHNFLQHPFWLKLNMASCQCDT